MPTAAGRFPEICLCVLFSLSLCQSSVYLPSPIGSGLLGVLADVVSGRSLLGAVHRPRANSSTPAPAALSAVSAAGSERFRATHLFEKMMQDLHLLSKIRHMHAERVRQAQGSGDPWPGRWWVPGLYPPSCLPALLTHISLGCFSEGLKPTSEPNASFFCPTCASLCVPFAREQHPYRRGAWGRPCILHVPLSIRLQIHTHGHCPFQAAWPSSPR